MAPNGNNRKRLIEFGGHPDWPYPDSILYTNYDGINPSGAICMADTSGALIRIIFDPTGRFTYSRMISKLNPLNGIIILNPQAPSELPDIWTLNSDGSNLRRLTDFSALDPSFSPDGTEIVYTDTRVENGWLWIMNLDGSNKRQITGIQ
jgi:hypothetical protein